MSGPPRLADPAEALARLLSLLPGPVPARPVPVAEAVGRLSAQTVTAPRPSPEHATAIVDGWAVAASDTDGAGPYSPAALPRRTARIRIGDAMPAGADAVLADWAAPGGSETTDAAAPGDGVRRRGEDVAAGAVLVRAGERVRATALPALHACGIDVLSVRTPRVHAPPGGFLAALLAAEAAEVVQGDADLTLAPEDGAASSIWLGSRPPAPAAFGARGGTPFVVVPGRWDEAYAVWLLLVRPALRRLAGASPPPAVAARLTRKVASAVGLLDVVLVRIAGPGLAEPLCVGAAPPGLLAAADAVLLVPPACEGYDAGAEVELEAL